MTAPAWIDDLLVARQWACAPWEVGGIEPPDFWERYVWRERTIAFTVAMSESVNKQAGPTVRSEQDVSDVLSELGI